MPVIPLPLPPETYDAPWKGALAAYFRDFMAFYFPDMGAAIDWSRAPVFLDKELPQVTRDAALGTRLADHLVQIYTRDGSKQWMLIHIEVQPQQRHAAKWKLARLLFARDWERQRVINLFHVIDWIMRLPKELEDQLWQDIVDLEGRKAMDTYVPRGARIAMMRELNEAREKAQKEGWLEGQRKGWEEGRRKGWEQGQAQGQAQGRQQGLFDGLLEGRQEGRQEGRIEGRQEGLADGLRMGQAALLARLLTKRFGQLPADAEAQIAGAELSQLQAWADAALEARTLAEVFKRH